MAMPQVLVECMGDSPGTSSRAHFQLIDGKLHIPTIQRFFKLSANLRLDDIVHATDAEGFTFHIFDDGASLRVSGDAVHNGGPTHRVLLVMVAEAEETVSGAEASAKRRKVQEEENLGLWSIPADEGPQPSLQDLTAKVSELLANPATPSWQYSFKYYGATLPIASNSALQEALCHFRMLFSSVSVAEAMQHCRIYVSMQRSYSDSSSQPVKLPDAPALAPTPATCMETSFCPVPATATPAPCCVETSFCLDSSIKTELMEVKEATGMPAGSQQHHNPPQARPSRDMLPGITCEGKLQQQQVSASRSSSGSASDDSRRHQHSSSSSGSGRQGQQLGAEAGQQPCLDMRSSASCQEQLQPQPMAPALQQQEAQQRQQAFASGSALLQASSAGTAQHSNSAVPGPAAAAAAPANTAIASAQLLLQLLQQYQQQGVATQVGQQQQQQQEPAIKSLAGESGAGEAGDENKGHASGPGTIDPGLLGFLTAKKETKTRHVDGRFKQEGRHEKKMAEMQAKCNELFDGAIRGHVTVLDHKRLYCEACQTTITAYSAYHTDCVRKHFLRHHEALLSGSGVELQPWRKTYEAPSSKMRGKSVSSQSLVHPVDPSPAFTSPAFQAAATFQPVAQQGQQPQQPFHQQQPLPQQQQHLQQQPPLPQQQQQQHPHQQQPLSQQPPLQQQLHSHAQQDQQTQQQQQHYNPQPHYEQQQNPQQHYEQQQQQQHLLPQQQQQLHYHQHLQQPVPQQPPQQQTLAEYLSSSTAAAPAAAPAPSQLLDQLYLTSYATPTANHSTSGRPTETQLLDQLLLNSYSMPPSVATKPSHSLFDQLYDQLIYDPPAPQPPSARQEPEQEWTRELLQQQPSFDLFDMLSNDHHDSSADQLVNQLYFNSYAAAGQTECQSETANLLDELYFNSYAAAAVPVAARVSSAQPSPLSQAGQPR